MSYVFPGSQTLNADQIAAEWRAAGAPANVASVFGGPLTTAEGGGSSGVLYNTAYPSLPGYTPVLAGNQPEYSVGLYGENIYGDLGRPPPAQAFAIGQKLAQNPQYQTDVAAQMFSQRGFEPWMGDAYVKGQGGYTAALRNLGYSSPPQLKGGVAFTANVPKAGKSAGSPSPSSSTSPAKKPRTSQPVIGTFNLLHPIASTTTTTLKSKGPGGLSWTWILVIVGLALLVWGASRSSGTVVRDLPEAAAA